LGNKDHILPPGWVCDNCNNYFSRKVEAPFLDSWYGEQSRFEMQIPNKKNRIPLGTGIHPQRRLEVNLMIDKDGFSMFAAKEKDEAQFMKTILSQKRGTLYVPMAGNPQLNYETARFIGKVALEILAHRLVDVEGGNDELVDKLELDELRDYVRQGKPGFIWPMGIRRIYPQDFVFSDEIDDAFQILHEWDLLVIPTPQIANAAEVYAVIAILGMEYVINLGGPELDGYLQWLDKNDNRSYLCSGKYA
jgi:hypothetical protein